MNQTIILENENKMNEVKPFNNNEDMEQVNETAVANQQAVEEARKKLAEKKQILANNAGCRSHH